MQADLELKQTEVKAEKSVVEELLEEIKVKTEKVTVAS